jgi:type VI protein secretion system component VasF
VTPVQDQTGTVPAHVDGDRMAPPGSRSSDEIRRDIVQQRQQLSRSVDALRTRWGEVTNVRHQIRQHKTELLVGAAAVGFLIGGAIALRRRRS